jgi:hypothetical protein
MNMPLDQMSIADLVLAIAYANRELVDLKNEIQRRMDELNTIHQDPFNFPTTKDGFLTQKCQDIYDHYNR